MSLKVKKLDCIYFFGIQSLFSNYFTTYSQPIYFINLCIKVLFFVWLCLKLLNRIKNDKLDKYMLIPLSFSGLLFLSTIINSGSIVKCFGYIAVILSFAILPMLSVRDNKVVDYRYLHMINCVFRLNIYLNFLLLIIFPDGLSGGNTRINYLGYDNICVPVILTGFCVMMFCNYIFKASDAQKVSDIFVCIASLLILWSGTGLIGFGILGVIIVIQKVFPHISWYKYVAIIAVVAFVLIVMFNSVEELSSIVELLGKDLTFTGRTYIWEATIEEIFKAPYLGKGIQESSALVFVPFTNDYRQAHNEYLQTVLLSGFIGASVFVTQYICSFLKVSAGYKQHKCRHNIYILAGLVAFLVISITETYSQYFMPSVLLSLGYYYSALDLNDAIISE